MIVAGRFVCFILWCLLSLCLFTQNSQLIVSGASSATGNSVCLFHDQYLVEAGGWCVFSYMTFRKPEKAHLFLRIIYVWGYMTVDG